MPRLSGKRYPSLAAQREEYEAYSEGVRRPAGRTFAIAGLRSHHIRDVEREGAGFSLTSKERRVASEDKRRRSEDVLSNEKAHMRDPLGPSSRATGVKRDLTMYHVDKKGGRLEDLACKAKKEPSSRWSHTHKIDSRVSVGTGHGNSRLQSRLRMNRADVRKEDSHCRQKNVPRGTACF